jgi:hypothetical protein
VVRLLFIIQVTDTGGQRCVALATRPHDCFVPGLEGGEHVVGIVLNDVVGNRASVDAALGRASTKTVAMFLSLGHCSLSRPVARGYRCLAGQKTRLIVMPR